MQRDNSGGKKRRRRCCCVLVGEVNCDKFNFMELKSKLFRNIGNKMLSKETHNLN